MKYEELHSRYGTHVSQRVRHELTQDEFVHVPIAALSAWLERRAETAHEEYRRLLNNPLATAERDMKNAGTACRRWRDAEDLAYLIAIAEDIGQNARAG
jgi:hypothetical protein